MRRHGAFEPHRLPPEELEYTTLPKVLEKLKDRWEDDVQERLSETNSANRATLSNFFFYRSFLRLSLLLLKQVLIVFSYSH